jgi:hypothetical protein
MDENLQVQNEEKAHSEKKEEAKSAPILNGLPTRDSMPEKLKKALEAGLKQ